ncbi:MAG: tetratricopeptide repeat protein [Steroidobacteraceae bacterium]
MTPDPAELARAHRSEADALLARGDEATALLALQKAIELDPASAWARFDLARLQQRGG